MAAFGKPGEILRNETWPLTMYLVYISLYISLSDEIRNNDIYRRTHKEFSKNGKGTDTQSGESMAARWKYGNS